MAADIFLNEYKGVSKISETGGQSSEAMGTQLCTHWRVITESHACSPAFASCGQDAVLSLFVMEVLLAEPKLMVDFFHNYLVLEAAVCHRKY